MHPLRLETAPVWTRVQASHDILAAVGVLLSAEDPAARFSRAYQIGAWDGRRRFLQPPRHVCLSGFVPRLRAWAARQGLAVEVAEHHPCPPPGRPWAEHLVHPRTGKPLVLRDYQDDVPTKLIARRRLSAQLPTASGKTEVGAETIRRLGLPSLWLIHRKDLLHQTRERLAAELRVPIGIIGDGQREVHDITVASVPTLRRWDTLDLDFWRWWQVLVLDEAHHSSADTWADVASQCTEAWYRLALSGTMQTGHPVRDLLREGVVGPLYVAATAAQLVEAGYLARPTISMVALPTESYPTYEAVREEVCPRWREDPRQLTRLGAKLYARAYWLGVVLNEARNEAIRELVARHVEAGEKVLVLVVRTAHGELLSERLPASRWIYGDDDSVVRAEVTEWFTSHPGGACVIASDIWREGVDVPEVNVFINAAGGASSAATLQRLGRALRPQRAGDVVMVYDFFDGAGGRKDYLHQHAMRREADYTREGYEVIHLRM